MTSWSPSVFSALPTACCSSTIFLQTARLCWGLLKLEASGATLVGAGIVIEKGFQPGGKLVRDRGIRVESLAVIASMDEKNGITFA